MENGLSVRLRPPFLEQISSTFAVKVALKAHLEVAIEFFKGVESIFCAASLQRKLKKMRSGFFLI